MIEVEAKVFVKDVKSIREKVKLVGKYLGRKTKIDDYYTLEPEGKYPLKSLRVRRIGRLCIVNFKKKLSYFKGIHAKNEVEFEVGDIANFFSLIKDFGFRKWLRKEKTSEIYSINKNFNIEINYVKQLGWFLEIECLCKKKEEIEKARKEILRVMKRIDVREKDIIEDGYTKLIWDKYYK